jgi:hypothetical protein
MTWPPYGSKEPISVQVHRPKSPLPSGPYSLAEEFDGRVSVVDGDVNVLATFQPEYRDLAEEMRDRLTIRRLARVNAFFCCPICGRGADTVRANIGDPALSRLFVHADGAEHEDRP